uniref:Uncharacterized protein n=1 Tax=Vespula pensylvanica TaxID=30213 RepID=A0A834NXB5_VESPE|nr:hypothetical protein H0235_010570 [Vespula pensylvanica]
MRGVEAGRKSTLMIERGCELTDEEELARDRISRLWYFQVETDDKFPRRSAPEDNEDFETESTSWRGFARRKVEKDFALALTPRADPGVSGGGRVAWRSCRESRGLEGHS